MFKLTLLFLVILVSLTSAKPSKTKFKCNAKDKKDIDQLVARIMTYGQEDRKYPVNKQEIKEYCREQKELVYKLEDYKSQCLKTRPKQVVAVIIYSIKSLINSYCRNVNSRKTKDLMTSAVCANAATFDYFKCSDQYVDLLQAVENSKDSKTQLAQMCCGYVEVFKCVQEQAAPHEECTEEHIEHNSNYIRGFFDNSVNVMCGEYNADSDKCDKFEFVRKPEKNNNKTRPASFFSPMVKVLTTM